MRSFFNGWRRKVGCVALVVALLLTTAWVRSLTIVDIVVIQIGDTVHSFPSQWGRLGWISNRGSSQSVSNLWSSFDAASPIDILDSCAVSDDFNSTWRWQLGGFDFGAADTLFADDMDGWSVAPYWSLVLPLTVVSACLILWKPRPCHRRRTTS